MSARRLRELSVVLGLVLMVLAGGIVVVWVSEPAARVGAPRTTAPGAIGSPTSAAFSPTQSATPAGTRSATPTGPTPGQPTKAPSQLPTSSPAASATAGGARHREITFVDLGIDTAGNPDEPPQPRYFTFVVDGPGRVEATVSDVSFGRVRMCVWQGEPGTEQDVDCETLRSGSIGRDVAEAGPSTWSVSVIGAQAGASPSADVRLRWPTDDARLHVSGFRFQGEAIENYNGFTVEVTPAADGGLEVAAAFDDGAGGAYGWRLEVESDETQFAEDGEGSSMSSGTTALAGVLYRVVLSNRQLVAEQRVLLSADIDWP